MYIQLDSQVLYYEKSGDGSPLILLHGNVEDHGIFDALMPHFEKYFSVIALDLRGCGLSSPAAEYHYDDMADDVIKLIVCGANLSPDGLNFFAKRAIKSENKKTKSDLVKMMLREPKIGVGALSAIKAPTLVVAGEKDMIKPEETKKIASGIPNATLIIVPKADHLSYIVHSELMAGKFLEFLG